MKIWYSNRHDTVDLHAFMIHIPYGSDSDPKSFPQLHHLCEHLFTKVAVLDTENNLSQWLDKQGIDFNAKTTRDSINLVFTSVEPIGRGDVETIVTALDQSVCSDEDLRSAVQEILCEIKSLNMRAMNAIKMATEELVWYGNTCIAADLSPIVHDLPIESLSVYMGGLISESTLLVDAKASDAYSMVETSSAMKRKRIDALHDITSFISTKKYGELKRDVSLWAMRPSQLHSVIISENASCSERERLVLAVGALMLTRGTRQGLLWEDATVKQFSPYHLLAWIDVTSSKWLLSIDFVTQTEVALLGNVIRKVVEEPLSGECKSVNEHFRLARQYLRSQLATHRVEGASLLERAATELMYSGHYDQGRVLETIDSLSVNDLCTFFQKHVKNVRVIQTTTIESNKFGEEMEK